MNLSFVCLLTLALIALFSTIIPVVAKRKTGAESGSVSEPSEKAKLRHQKYLEILDRQHLERLEKIQQADRFSEEEKEEWRKWSIEMKTLDVRVAEDRLETMSDLDHGRNRMHRQHRGRSSDRREKMESSKQDRMRLVELKKQFRTTFEEKENRDEL